MKKFLTSYFLLLTFVISSCTMIPKYQRPEPTVPFAKPEENKPKISEISWEEYFQSKDVQRVVKLALENNNDLKVADFNIEAAQANHEIARANLFPNINAVGAKSRQGVPSAFKGFTPRTQYRANLTLASFELDFFGRLRSLKEVALEQFLASKEAREVMKITLISETVNSYAQLIADSETFKIAKLNLDLQNEKYDLINKKYEFGISSKSDQINALSDLETARNNYENYRKLVESDKHALMALCGIFDEKVLPTATSLDEIKIKESVLNFVASETLLSRPDIKQAEHSLKSANANIGAARAAFFPSVTLTGNYGYASTGFIQDVIAPGSKSWLFNPQISLPIFNGGRNFANLKASKVQKNITITQYQKAIQTAFRETLDELETRKTVTAELEFAEELLKGREEYFKIFKVRNEVGITNKSDLLDAKVLFLSARQAELGAKKEHIANLINLYKVLGGGSDIVEEKTEKKSETK